MMEDISNEYLVDTPDDIEQVIEGGGDGERRNISGQESGSDDGRKENENKENQNEQDKDKIKVKRKIGPRPIVNPDRLKGPRGLVVMESFFSDVRPQGKGREREDLEAVIGRLEHWTHRLCPKMQFDDALRRIEKLGSRKDVSNLVKRIRLGMEDEEGAEAPILDPPDSPPPCNPSPDPFDQLLSPHSAPAAPVTSDITDEQRERMLQNRLIAEERRAARIQKAREMQERFRNNAPTLSQVEGERLPASHEDLRAVENPDREPMDVDGEEGDGGAECGNPAASGIGNGTGGIGNQAREMANQPDLLGNGGGDAASENGMDVEEMQPDILSGNHVRPDLLSGNPTGGREGENFGIGDQPDVLRAEAGQMNRNRPDILAGGSNPPDILAGRRENPPDLVERNSNPPDLLS